MYALVSLNGTHNNAGYPQAINTDLGMTRGHLTVLIE